MSKETIIHDFNELTEVEQIVVKDAESRAPLKGVKFALGQDRFYVQEDKEPKADKPKL